MNLRATEDRMVVVSDLHLGCPASTADRDLGRFVDEVFDAGWSLCINGDGFDLLQSSLVGLANSAFPVLARLNARVGQGMTVRYVLGNHDLVLEHILFDLGFTVSPFLNLRSGDRLIRIEHGHVYEPFYARFPGLYEFGGRVGRLALLARADVYEWWARAQQRIDDRRRAAGDEAPYPHHAAEDLFRRGFDAVVFGHTHQPELRSSDGHTFVNSGDWLRRRTYVTIDEGSIELHEWQPGQLAG